MPRFSPPAHHALYTAERLYQARRESALSPALATALILVWGEIFGALTGRSTIPYSHALAPLPTYTLLVTGVLALGLMLLALIRAAASITREREAGAWALITLTPVSARGIIWAKWWATMRGLERLIWLVVVLRAGVTVWHGAELDRMTYLATGGLVGSRIFPPDPVKVLLVLPLMAVMTWVTVGLIAAVGVAVSAHLRRSAAAVAASLIAVVVFAGGFAGAAVLSAAWAENPRSLPRQTRDYAAPFFVMLAYTALDNGTTLGTRLVDYEVRYNYRSEAYVATYHQQRANAAWWGGLLMTVGVYSAAALLALALARRAVWRDGALPPSDPPPRPRTRTLARPANAALS
jgi:ABC-type transport system involved in multi-copper enzyme maturation permease subunit